MVVYHPEWATRHPTALVIPILLSIASYNVFELLIWIFNTFERRQGLYFGSILTATLALAGYLVASFLKLLTPNGTKTGTFVFGVSYATLLTAHILVLYSRLHLLLPHNPRVLRSVLLMIIITSVLTVPVQIILCFNVGAGDLRFLQPQYVFEQVVFMGAFLRELIVCIIYMVQAYRNLRPIVLAKGRAGKKIMVYLILIQVIVIILDMGLIVQLYLGLEETANGYGAVLYSVKLKMEFGILNALVDLLKCPVVQLPSTLGGPSIVGSSATSSPNT
ncbi:hypothetical protein BDW62DRAFT_37437 [Aspergillus aurantiobrunneus]